MDLNRSVGKNNLHGHFEALCGWFTRPESPSESRGSWGYILWPALYSLILPGWIVARLIVAIIILAIVGLHRREFIMMADSRRTWWISMVPLSLWAVYVYRGVLYRMAVGQQEYHKLPPRFEGNSQFISISCVIVGVYFGTWNMARDQYNIMSAYYPGTVENPVSFINLSPPVRDEYKPDLFPPV